MSAAIDWWSSLKHGGLLIAPDKVVSDFLSSLARCRSGRPSACAVR